MTNQDDIIKFVQDKDNIAKAVEGSMEKRAKVLTNQDMNTWLDELFDEYYPVGTVVAKDTAEDEKAALMTMVLEHRRNLFKALILAKFKENNMRKLILVDRLEVVDETGRAYVKGSIYGSPVRVELSLQDDDRTLKVFVEALTKQTKESNKSKALNQPEADKEFNANDARTWDDKQQQVYEVGHREGESCESASWTLMLDEAFDIEATTPEEAKASLLQYMDRVRIDELETIGNEGWSDEDSVLAEYLDMRIEELKASTSEGSNND